MTEIAERQPRTRASNGRSSIYQDKAGQWHGYVSMGLRNDGKPDRRHVRGATQNEVTDKVRALEQKREQGRVTQPGKSIRLDDWLDHWLTTVVARKIRPSTLDGYRSLIEHQIKPRIGAHWLHALEPEHIERMEADMLADGLAPATVLKTHRVLSRSLQIAAKRKRVSSNVCADVEAPSVQRDEVRPLSAEESRAILAAARGTRGSARWAVALALGLRQGEALGLRWEDVDLDAQCLRVRYALQRQTGKGLVLVEPKTKRSRRTVPLPEQLTEALRQHREEQDRERAAAGSEWDNKGFVFCQPNGRPIDHRRDWQTWKDLLSAAGVRDARLHDARHTAATLMLAQGVPARVAMEVLGHSQISLTLDTYTHVVPELSRDAANRMGKAMWG